jgi:fructose-bisphosphate aldolase class II
MHAQVHEEMGLCKMEEIAPIMLMFAKSTKVPVCVHLDHGTDVEYVKRGLELGFTSVMYDGSTLPYEENVKNTCIVVAEARKKNISVEAEVGSMGAREGGGEEGTSVYTDPLQAKEFVDITGIDALACAFGTAHGIYTEEPKLDFERVGKINSMVSVPLVMHGGSGVSDQDYIKVIDLGIRKLNYYTYMAKAGGNAVQEMSDKTFFHDIEMAAIEAMKENVIKAIKVFSKKGEN